MKLWSWKRELGKDEGEVYMVRYQLLVLGKWLRVYVNKICRPDHDPRLHTHPYRASWSLKLWGSYWEQIPAKDAKHFKGQVELGLVDGTLCLVHKPKRWSKIPLAHRIVELINGPTWTLFIGWRRDIPWGFQNEDGSFEEWASDERKSAQ